MTLPLSWFRPSPDNGDASVYATVDVPTNETPASSGAAAVPIRAIGPAHREHVAQNRRYVAQLNFERDELLGIFNRKLELIAMAHLAFSVDPQCLSCAEFGVSVAKNARGRRYGSQLFERAVIHARNEGVTMLFIHALSENTAMLKIARGAGAIIERDGSESEAHLRLPPADFDSRVTELVNEQVARTNYHLKVQAKQFWSVLHRLQAIRQGLQQRLLG